MLCCAENKITYQIRNFRIIHAESRPACCWKVSRPPHSDFLSLYRLVEAVRIRLIQPVRRAFRYHVDYHIHAIFFCKFCQPVQIIKDKMILLPLDIIPNRPKLYHIKSKLLHIYKIAFPTRPVREWRSVILCSKIHVLYLRSFFMLTIDIPNSALNRPGS